MRRGRVVIAAILITMSMPVHAAEIPEDIKATADEIGSEYNVSPAFIEAICYEESRFTPAIINRSGRNYGLMQIDPSFNTARMERLGVTKEDLLTVRGNILTGTDLLSELFQEYEDPVMVLLLYGGFSQKKIDAYINKGTIPGYITKLLNRAQQYEQEKEVSNDTANGEEDAVGDQGDGGNGQDGDCGEVSCPD